MEKHLCLVSGEPTTTHEQGFALDGFTLVTELTCGCKIWQTPGREPKADYVTIKREHTFCTQYLENMEF